MAEIEIGLAEAGTLQTVTVGDELVVALDETPTSGYRWALEAFDDSIVALRDRTFVGPDHERLGAAGSRRFRIAVIGPGETALTFVNRRSWERDAVGDRFEVTIDAQAG
ncbi:MAG TPA: protease inhibitor I42 family protein [Candidatus Limnocylindrales bacterium]